MVKTYRKITTISSKNHTQRQKTGSPTFCLKKAHKLYCGLVQQKESMKITVRDIFNGLNYLLSFIVHKSNVAGAA